MSRGKLEGIFADLHFADTCCEEGDRINNGPTKEDTVVVPYSAWLFIRSAIKDSKAAIEEELMFEVFKARKEGKTL